MTISTLSGRRIHRFLGHCARIRGSCQLQADPTRGFARFERLRSLRPSVFLKNRQRLLQFCAKSNRILGVKKSLGKTVRGMRDEA
jgi:hypothetical protein